MNIIERLKEQVRQVDTTLILYRVYFLLATVSSMLIVILLLSVQVQEQIITITSIYTTKEVIESTAEVLYLTVSAQEQACANICATSVAEALTRYAIPATPTPIPTTTFTPTVPPSQTPTASATAMATTTATATSTGTATTTITPTPSSSPTLSFTPTMMVTVPTPKTSTPKPTPTPSSTPTSVILDSIVPNHMTRQPSPEPFLAGCRKNKKWYTDATDKRGFFFGFIHKNPLNLCYPCPMQRFSDKLLDVEITGDYFMPGVLAWLADQEIFDISNNDTTITGTVPMDMLGGRYNLTVTNPDMQTATMRNAFTVYDPQDFAPLNLVTFGLEASTYETLSGELIPKSVQLIFFDMPDIVTEPIFIHIYDPGTENGNHNNELFDILGPEQVEFDSDFIFRVYGREGFYMSTAYIVPPPSTISETYLLRSKEILDDEDLITTFGPFIPSEDADHYGGKYIFGLKVDGISGDDGNVYDVGISHVMTPTGSLPMSVPGSRMFSFLGMIALTTDESEHPTLYPYIPESVSSVVQNNCGFGNSGSPRVLRILTSKRIVPINDAISNGDNCEYSSILLELGYEDTTNWSINLRGVQGQDKNGVAFWINEEGGLPFALFTRAGLNVPP